MSEKQTLSNLTPRVLQLLAEARGADVDLAAAETQLGINKRRLYDIVNVLTGIGVIERSGKSKIRLSAQSTQSIAPPPEPDRSYEIDQISKALDTALDDLMTSEDYSKYAFVTPEDIRSLNPNPQATFLYLKGTPSMTIEFSEDVDGNQMICSDRSGPIQLLRVADPPK